jgi:hypothetical protein
MLLVSHSTTILSGLNMTYTYTDPQTTAATSKQAANFINNGTSDVSNYYWTDVKRTVDTFVNFNTNDYLAYFCTSVTSDLNTMITNYIRASNVFFLDYNPDLTTVWSAPAMGFDKGEQVVKSDITSNLKMVLSPPVNIPI